MDSISESPNDTHGDVIFWRIENFHFHGETKNFFLSSPNFTLKGMNWQLEIKQKNEFLAAYLFKEASHIGTKVFISACLLTESGWINNLRKTEVKYEAFRTGWGVHELVSFEILEKQKSFYMPRESLTISFHIWNDKFKIENSQRLIISRMDNECKLSHQPMETFSCLTHEDLLYFLPSYEFQSNKTPKLRNSLKPKQVASPGFSETDEYSGNDLFKLLKRKNLGFVTIRTAGKEFFVLKAVLCAESSVLNTMLENNYDCNFVDMYDIDSDTMTAVMIFLHYKTLRDIGWSTIVKLLYVAEKYQIGRLRRFCVSFLKKEISIENVCDAIVFASMYQNLQLTTYINKYFCKNSSSILQSEKWKEFSVINTELATNMLGQLAENGS